MVLHLAKIFDNKLVCLYYKDGKYTLVVFDLQGEAVRTLTFEEGYTVSGFSGNNNDNEVLYYVRSFYCPTAVYKMNLTQGTIETLSQTKILFDHTQFETRLVKYKSKDGTRIPMFLTFKKGENLSTGDRPVLLYGYGGFGATLVPHFDAAYVQFLESGGVLATPQIRGGGEFGDYWHEQGKNLNKQNSFDDFIAAAEFLINIKMTNPSKIAIIGGSNGGLLVGAVLTQRPELFAVAIAEMGLFDMVRYDNFGIGWVHHDEYGNPADSVEFLNLLSYSPLHNLKKGVRYPPTLLLTADNDDRVPPLHSFKFLATLQHNADGSIPYLMHMAKKAGHYGSSALEGEIDTSALKYTFIMMHLGMKPN